MNDNYFVSFPSSKDKAKKGKNYSEDPKKVNIIIKINFNYKNWTEITNLVYSNSKN